MLRCFRWWPAAALAFAISMPTMVAAQDATWSTNPASGDWNDSTNWLSGAVPIGVATFGITTKSTLTLTGSASPFDIDSMVFAPSAPQYGFTLLDQVLSIHGLGIVNNSAFAPTFDLDPTGCGCSNITFHNTSTAGIGTYNLFNGSEIDFLENSSGGSSTFNINDGIVFFTDFSDAGNSILHVGSNGALLFGAFATGGTARVINDAGGQMDLGFQTGPISLGSIEGAGSVNLGYASLTVGSNNLSTTVSGDITDFGYAGSLTKVGTGTLTLTGMNGWTGGTTVSDGTLVANTNSIGGAIVNNATIELDQPFDGTFDGAIVGTGALVKNGSGIIGITFANAYTGSTTINAGTLQALAPDVFAPGSAHVIASGATLDLNNFDQTIGSLAGAGTVTLGSGNLTTGGDNSSTTFSGSITGTGGLTKTGFGTFTLTGTNSYTGGTTISQGTLAGTTTSLQGDIVDNATLEFNQTFDGTYAGSIGGTGSLVKGGTGIVTLAGVNSYTGGTIIGGGTLAGTTSSLQGAIVDNATLQFDQTTNGAYAGVISGSGSLLKTGSGIVTLNGANTYTGTTTVNGGTLRAGIANVFSSASATTIAGGATLDLNNFDQTLASLNGAGSVMLGSARLTTVGFGTFDGNITGTGGLTNSGSLRLTGTNTYSGGTINNGSLSGTTTSLQGTITGNGITALWQDTDGTFVGSVNGGFLIKAGAGSVTLANANDLGALLVGQGTLRAGAPAAFGTTSLIDVLGGATLDFNGHDHTVQGIQTSASSVVQLGSANLTIGTTVVPDILAGSITGSGSLTFTGTGTVDMRGGTNSYTGGTTINGATVYGDTGSLQGNIANNGSSIVVFDQPGDGTYSGVMSGTGALWKWGSGTVAMTGANTFSGGTVISQGVIAMNSASSLGTGQIQINGGGLRFDAPMTLTQPLAMSSAGASFETSGVDVTLTESLGGGGSLTKLGNGTLTLTGVNSYSGGTFVDGGTLAGTTSSLQGTIVDNAEVRFDQSTDGTFGGKISGTGSLTKIGSGTVTLTGANTYLGATAVVGGTLRAGGAGVLPAGSAFTVGGNATLDLNNFDQTIGSLAGAGTVAIGSAHLTTGADNTSTTFAGTISGSGGLTKIGAGTLTLSGVNSYTGGTIVAGGTLAGTTATLQGSIVDNAIVRFDQSADGTFAGAVSGTGSIVKSGSGAVTLAGANSYAGGTLVLGGALVGTSASLQGGIVNNALVQFDQSANGTYAGAMSGTGALVKTGAGALTLTGVNSYAGGTLVAGGSLVGDSSSLQGVIVDDASITFAQATAGTFLGTLVGAGSLTKSGAGTLTFAATQPMTGTATVAQGTLALGGAFGGSIHVDPGATLTVAPGGSVAGATVSTHRGITVAAAGAGGVSTIVGDLTLEPASTLQLGVGSGGTAPVLATGGAAHLNGATLDVTVAGTPSRVTQTVVLAANGGMDGTVAVHSSNGGIDPIAVPVGDLLVVSLLNMNAPLAIATAQGNAARAGAAFDRIKRGSTGDLGTVIRELTALDDDSLAAALTSTAGEIHASNVQMAALDAEAVADVVQNRLTDWRRGSEANSASAATRGWRTGLHWWSQLVGQSASFDATGDVHGGDAALGGVVVGVDDTFADGWLAGAGGSYEAGTLTLTGTSASNRYNAPRGFAYVGRAIGAWTARAGGSVAWTSDDTTRHMAFAATLSPAFGGQRLFNGIDRTATSAQGGLTSDVWGGVEAQSAAGAWSLQPRVGLRYAHFGHDAWQESGAGALSLAAPAQAQTSAQAEGGVRATRVAGRVAPFGTVTYRRELTDGSTGTTVQVSNDAAGQFLVDGIAFARDTLLAGGGLQMPIGRGDLSFGYQLRRAAEQTRHTVSVGVGF